MNKTIFCFLLFYLLQQFGKTFQVVGIYIEIEYVVFAVYEFVGGEGVYVQVMLDGALLFFGQIIVHHVRANYIILLDDVLPRLIGGFGKQLRIESKKRGYIIKIYPHVFLQFARITQQQQLCQQQRCQQR